MVGDGGRALDSLFPRWSARHQPRHRLSKCGQSPATSARSRRRRASRSSAPAVSKLKKQGWSGPATRRPKGLWYQVSCEVAFLTMVGPLCFAASAAREDGTGREGWSRSPPRQTLSQGGHSVHTASRVAGLAGANEVWVSSTVEDLVAGSGLEFHDRGVHELKGVPGPWRALAAKA